MTPSYGGHFDPTFQTMDFGFGNTEANLWDELNMWVTVVELVNGHPANIQHVL